MTLRTRCVFPLLFGFAGTTQAQTVTLDFAGAPIFVTTLPWSEEGFTCAELDGAGYVHHVGAEEHLIVAADGSGGARVRLAPDAGRLFDVLSVDIVYASTLLLFGSGQFRLESDRGSRPVFDSDEGTTVQLAGPAWTGIQYLDLVYVGDTTSGEHDMAVDNIVLRTPSAVPTLDGGALALLSLGLLTVGGACLHRNARRRTRLPA